MIGSPLGVGERAGHHVANDVTARAEGREQRGVDPGDEWFQLTLVDHVVLNTLACRQAKPVVGESGHAIECQPLVGADHATGNRGTNHAGVVERSPLLGAGPADVAVVLLIDAVELQQQLGVVFEVGRRRCEFGVDGAGQVPAVDLDLFGAHVVSGRFGSAHSIKR